MALLSELIRHDKPIATRASAVYPYKPMLERKYRFVSRFGDEVLLHRVDKKNGLIYLPRGLCPIGQEDQRREGVPVQFKKCFEKRPDQVSWFDETIAFLKKGQSGITVAGTGRGKTLCGFNAAYELGVKTLVVTTKDDIYKQWIEGAQKFLGLQPHEVGEIRSNKCEVQGTKFCVAMIHSLSKEGKYPDWAFDEFGLVIFDECHRLPAEQFSNVADMLPAKCRLGLSAAVERADGKETLLLAHIGPIRVRAEAELMVPKVLVFKSAWECPRSLRTDKDTGAKVIVRMPHEPGKTTHLEKIIAADPVRNHLIAELIAAGFEKDRKIVVFSTLIEHLRSLHRACQQTFKLSGRQMGFYIGAHTRAEREHREREKAKPILFTTYSMMAEGTDIPWLDLCVLAMPRSNVIQPVGRVRREYPDKAQPVVIDIQDHDSPVFSGYAGKRLAWYKSIGADIKLMQ